MAGGASVSVLAVTDSNGKLPCAPSTAVPSGMTRVWHIAHEVLPIAISPFRRITYRAKGMMPSRVSGTRCCSYQFGSRTMRITTIGPS